MSERGHRRPRKRKAVTPVEKQSSEPKGGMAPRKRAAGPLHGAMRGSVKLAPGTDLTEPTIDEKELDAARGVFHR